MSIAFPRHRELPETKTVNTVWSGGDYNGSFSNDLIIWATGFGTDQSMLGHLDPPINIPVSEIVSQPPGAPDNRPEWRGVDWDRIYEVYILPRYNDIVEAYTEMYLSQITSGWTIRTHASRMSSGFMDDIVVPDFKSRSAAGEVIISDMRQEKQTFVASAIEDTDLKVDTSAVGISFQRPTGWSYSFGYSSKPGGFIRPYVLGTWSAPLGAATIPESVMTQTISYLEGLGHIGNSQNAINNAGAAIDQAILDLPVTAAEAAKTVDHLGLTLIRLAKIVSSIKKGKFFKYAPQVWKRVKEDIRTGKFTKYADYAADAWLEARYAWRPLIYDANNVIKLIKSEKELIPRQTFRGHDGDQEPISHSFSVSDGTYIAQVELEGVHTSSHRAGFLCQTRFENALANQLGLFNVAGAVWEIIPYSFVVDWFINIGGLLRSLNPNPTFRSIGSWLVSHSYYDVTGTVTYTLPDNSTESVTFRATKSIKERIPDVGITFVNLDIDLDVPKLLDGLSLLIKAKLR
jgi:hypothetical protein